MTTVFCEKGAVLATEVWSIVSFRAEFPPPSFLTGVLNSRGIWGAEPRGAELGISDVYLYGLWSLMGTVVAKGPHVGRTSRMSTLLSRALSHVTLLGASGESNKF